MKQLTIKQIEGNQPFIFNLSVKHLRIRLDFTREKYRMPFNSLLRLARNTFDKPVRDLVDLDANELIILIREVENSRFHK